MICLAHPLCYLLTPKRRLCYKPQLRINYCINHIIAVKLITISGNAKYITKKVLIKLHFSFTALTCRAPMDQRFPEERASLMPPSWAVLPLSPNRAFLEVKFPVIL